jgi:uncharacterized phage infection (PIP) family protein YhgE
MYEDTVLIKLRRDYEKNEVVMFALNKIKEQEVEIGKLKSYISELEDGNVEFKEIQEYKNKCDKYKETINKLQVENKILTYSRVNIKEAENKIKAELRKSIKLSKEELKEFGLGKLSKENDSLKKEKAKLVRWAERLKETIKELKENR